MSTVLRLEEPGKVVVRVVEEARARGRRRVGDATYVEHVRSQNTTWKPW